MKHVAPGLAVLAVGGWLVACDEDPATIPVAPTTNATYDAGRSSAIDGGPSDAGAADSQADATTVATAPVLDQEPRDRTVAEGRTAVFQVAAQGTNLAFLWERSDDSGGTWSAAGSTLAEHTLAVARAGTPALGGDDGARVRVRVDNSLGSVTSRVALLRVIAANASARVYVQSPAGVVYDHVLGTTSGTGYTATADLAAGTFGGRAEGTTIGRHAYAGLNTVKLFNHHPTAVTLPAGSVKLTYAGTYSHAGPQGTTLSTASCSGILSAAISPNANFDRSVRLTHQTVQPSTEPSITRVEELNGGRVVSVQHSASALQAELELGELVVPPGQTLSLSVTLTPAATLATADFSATPARISVRLPPGIALDDDSTVPLTWVTH